MRRKARKMTQTKPEYHAYVVALALGGPNI
jgi:hypothetical protein